MPEWTRRLAAVLSARLGRRRDEERGWEHTRRVVRGLDAMLGMERALCDSVILNDSREGIEALVGRGLGEALCGRRVCVAFPRIRAASLARPLGEAVRMHAPLVVHAGVRDGQANVLVDEAAACGAIALWALSAQHLIDLVPLAHAIAELALLPVLVLAEVDGVLGAIETVEWPQPRQVRAWVGRPSDSIEPPTPAQRLLFGERRRRVVAWADPDRPAGVGWPMAGEGQDVQALWRAFFEGGELDGLIGAAFEAAALHMGRALGPVVARGVGDGASTAAVATGAAGRALLEASDEDRLAVVCPVVVHPIDADRIATLLGGAGEVFVFDPPAGTGDAPLATRVRSSVPHARPVAWLRAAEQLGADELRDAILSLRSGASSGAEADAATEFPRREAFVQRVRGAMKGRNVPPAIGCPPSHRGPTPRTVAVVASGEELSQEALDAFFSQARRQAGGAVSGRFVESSGAAAVVLAPGKAGEAPPWPLPEAVFATRAGLRGLRPKALGACPCSVLVVGGLGEAETQIAPAWMRAASRSGARVVDAGDEGLARLAERAAAWMGGNREAASAGAPLDVPAPRVEPVPGVVRAWTRTDTRWDNPARTWTEHIEPANAGEDASSTPDPYAAAGVVPPATAALAETLARTDIYPLLDPTRCTGCGACWTACPDSSIVGVAVEVRAALDATLREARTAGDIDANAESALRRALRQAARALETRLARSGQRSVEAEAVAEAFETALAQRPPDGGITDALRAAARAVAQRAQAGQWVACEPLFHQPHANRRGEGRLLALAIHPGACQGCGLCVEACAYDALHREPATPALREFLRKRWALWEELPDTDGKTIDRAAKASTPGPMAAALLTRHCSLALPGGDPSEPGSGARLAVRLIVAAVEFARQRTRAALLDELGNLAGELRVTIDRAAAAALRDDAAIDALRAALDRAEGSVVSLGEVLAELSEQGVVAPVERARLAMALDGYRSVRDIREALTGANRRAARARHAIVLPAGSIEGWSLRYPFNPFEGPAVAEALGTGAALAEGLAAAWMHKAVAEARALRLARLAVRWPSDWRGQADELASLDWDHLDDAERSLAPVTIAVVPAARLLRAERLLPALHRHLPLLLTVADPLDLHAPLFDAGAMAMWARQAVGACVSVARPDHLLDAIVQCLKGPQANWVHVYTPSPRAHGFPTDATQRRAAEALASRLDVLLHWRRPEEGGFGLGLDLSGNPAFDELWAPWPGDEGDPCEPWRWAQGEGRWRGAFRKPKGDERTAPLATWLDAPASVALGARPVVDSGDARNGEKLLVPLPVARAQAAARERWQVLRELCGAANPFAQRAAKAQREADEQEMEAARREALAEARAESEARRTELDEEMVRRVRDNLLRLAGYGPGGAAR